FRLEGAQSEVMVQRPEYTGGIGPEGVVELQKFVRAGGTLIALDTAADLPREFFLLPLLNVGGAPFSCPGSLVRLAVDTSQPLAFGMPKDAVAIRQRARGAVCVPPAVPGAAVRDFQVFVECGLFGVGPRDVK